MAVDAARAKSLFLAASDLDAPAESGAYLKRECGSGAELRAGVEALQRAGTIRCRATEKASQIVPWLPLASSGSFKPASASGSVVEV